jgi:hypothetical protein
VKFAAYHQAAHPEPRIVLGRLLQPYSLGHVELLHACESNFTNPAATELTWDDLALALVICGGSYEQGKALLWRIRSEPRFARQHARVMFKWGKKLPEPDINAAALAFLDYLQAGSQTINIRYTVPQTEGGNEAPEHQMVKCHFLFNSCLNESQIMNRPWGLAKSEWMTHLALRGEVTALDDEPNEEQKQFEQRAAALPDLSQASSLNEALNLIRKQNAERKAAEAKPETGGET